MPTAVHRIGDRDPEDLLECVSLIMIRTCVGCGIVEAVTLGAPDIIGRKFQTLDVHGIFFRILSDLLGGYPGPVGKNIPETFAESHQPEQSHHCLIISEIEFQPPGIFL